MIQLKSHIKALSTVERVWQCWKSGKTTRQESRGQVRTAKRPDLLLCRYPIMPNAGMDIKSLQYVMGHSDVGATLNIYTHASFDWAVEPIASPCVPLRDSLKNQV